MEPGHHGADRDVEDLRRVCVAEVAEIDERERILLEPNAVARLGRHPLRLSLVRLGVHAVNRTSVRHRLPTTPGVTLLFRAGGYARPVEERPETEEHPESEPTSLDDGQSMEPGEGPNDEDSALEQLHGVPDDR